MLIDIFDKQIEKIKNMKKLIFGVALIGIASIGFSFMEIDKKGNEDYCVEINCDGNRWTETINCPTATSATKIAKTKYPNCSVGNARKCK